MTAQLIDGVGIARRVRADWKPRVGRLAAQGMTPGLAVIMVGENPASQVYVRNKVRACGEMGIHSEEHRFPESATTAEMLAKIEALNARPAIHGILVQLPLPASRRSAAPARSRSPTRRTSTASACTTSGGLVERRHRVPARARPTACTCLLEYSDDPDRRRRTWSWSARAHRRQADGADAAPEGRDRRRSATSGPATSPSSRSSADILIVAAGKPKLITAPMVQDRRGGDRRRHQPPRRRPPRRRRRLRARCARRRPASRPCRAASDR